MTASYRKQPDPVFTLLLTARPGRCGSAGGKVYELMRSGALRSVKIGGSRRISATALAEYVAGLERAA